MFYFIFRTYFVNVICWFPLPYLTGKKEVKTPHQGKSNTLLQIKSKYVNLSLETSKLLTLNLSNLRMAILGISTDEKEETRKYIDGYK